MLSKILNLIRKYRYLFLLYFFISILLFTNAIYEFRQSKKDLLDLLKHQSETSLKALILSSENLMRNNYNTQKIIQQQLARTVEMFYVLTQKDKMHLNLLDSLSRQIGIEGLLFLSSDFVPFLISGQFKSLNLDQLNYLLNKAFDLRTLTGDTIFWHETFPQKDSLQTVRIGCRFLPDGKILMLSSKAWKKRMIAERVDFGTLIRKLTKENSDIVYLALQDSANIIAAAGKVQLLNPSALQNVKKLPDSLTASFKIIDFDSLRIFEASYPFYFQGKNIGIFRLGLSTKALDNINQRIFKRLLILSFILIGFAFLIFTFTFVRQRYDILHQEYKEIETYSSMIIENVSDAILVFNQRDGILIFNRSAEELFGLKKEKVLKKPINILIEEDWLNNLNISQVHEKSLKTDQGLKTVLTAQSQFKDSRGMINQILVLRDISEQKRLEDRMKRQEQLTAMGQLAAGVAHEIRNPLNSISTIVQQLIKDFKPLNDNPEYMELMQIIRTEIKRINQKIEEFLKFSRPKPLHLKHFKLSAWLHSLLKQYYPVFKERNINFELKMDWDGIVFWDEEQLRDALINLIQNALEALNTGGNLHVEVTHKAKKIIIKISDSGKGISPEHLNKIFNLYFTTKPSGTGIGLSMVQRIIFEHEGLIEVESTVGQGSTFIITLPQSVGLDEK